MGIMLSCTTFKKKSATFPNELQEDACASGMNEPQHFPAVKTANQVNSAQWFAIRNTS